MSKRIQLNTNYSKDHQIVVGYKLEDQIISFLSDNFSLKKAVFIIDENVLDLYQDSYINSLKSLFDEIVLCSVPEGEQSKSLSQYTKIVDSILKSKVERSTPVIVIGGGVTGDLGGFAAASTLRGMPLIHIPTSLLAMVDSSIGGKTGINHSVGKNLIGAFYSPVAVFADLQFLETLAQKEIANGLGEVIKYGMISTPSIIEDLEKLPISEPFVYSKDWEHLVALCAKIKADIVAKDFKESGLREILNFGHTFAHVIERVRGYENSSHGEAVFMGMWGAVKLSNLLGFNIDIANLSGFRALYTSKFDPEESVAELTELMLHDKKVKDGSIKVIMLEKPGIAKPRIIKDVSIIQESWKFIIEEFN
ncbi:3-dehydroquinate synthase [bacterium]|nr:3-dehydroquinate synthase [bacterium]